MDMPATARTAPAVTASAYCDAILARHRCQERSNDCGPFCAAMVINALTPYDVDPVDLGRAMARPRWGAMLGVLPLVRRVPGSATFPWGMVDVLRAHGLNARWRVLGTRAGLARGLAAGHVFIPIVGALRPRPWAHYMVLLAHDPVQGWGFADPESRHGRLSWRSDATFARQWGTYGRITVEVRPVAPPPATA
ncbi:MAG: hypothetical protein DYG90_05200 [Chloroflexi bacterium CFX6]|nr:hypothetical protein [Chloroflexi bacterium CFX6]